MDAPGNRTRNSSLQTKCDTFSPMSPMRLMGAAPMTFGWKPNALLLNYSRLIAVNRIELLPEAHEASMQNHYTTLH